MKLQIFSDLHGDVFAPKAVKIWPDVDVVVVAGDVCEGAENAFPALREFVPQVIPIIMVMGNHEYYGRCLPEELELARRIAPNFNIRLLEDDVAVIDGVRFIGSTLWTDYELFGHADMPLAMHTASSGLNDHRKISWSNQPWKRFRPQEARQLHRQSRSFIEMALSNPHPGPSAVVTHHAPHRGSLHPHYESNLLSAAYVSDMSRLFESVHAPQLWIHGHIHYPFDYQAGSTRILCNPHGYGFENPYFNPSLVVEIAS